ncbi:uncharacterized protein LOC133911281 [Phragmites australis]|uniref:uncharacterized protein LOC133911281 n=1 Tax=Phragmites australis TaxID=29695 RepID=UPI002D795692|nr:uncharacterized protein LOC133911281 [Phragmites australis]
MTSNAQQPQLLDPKERKRQRDRDRYAQMSVERKEELLKKRREARQQKKVATISNVERHQPGQSALSELRYTPTSEGATTSNQENMPPIESIDWLHRNDTYQRQRVNMLFECQENILVGTQTTVSTIQLSGDFTPPAGKMVGQESILNCSQSPTCSIISTLNNNL